MEVRRDAPIATPELQSEFAALEKAYHMAKRYIVDLTARHTEEMGNARRGEETAQAKLEHFLKANAGKKFLLETYVVAPQTGHYQDLYRSERKDETNE